MSVRPAVQLSAVLVSDYPTVLCEGGQARGAFKQTAALEGSNTWLLCQETMAQYTHTHTLYIYIYIYTDTHSPNMATNCGEIIRGLCSRAKNMNIKFKRHDATVLVGYDNIYTYITYIDVYVWNKFWFMSCGNLKGLKKSLDSVGFFKNC